MNTKTKTAAEYTKPKPIESKEGSTTEFSFDLSNYALKHEVYKLFLGMKVIWSETIRNTEHFKINITIDEKDLDKNKAR